MTHVSPFTSSTTLPILPRLTLPLSPSCFSSHPFLNIIQLNHLCRLWLATLSDYTYISVSLPSRVVHHRPSLRPCLRFTASFCVTLVLRFSIFMNLKIDTFTTSSFRYAMFCSVFLFNSKSLLRLQLLLLLLHHRYRHYFYHLHHLHHLLLHRCSTATLRGYYRDRGPRAVLHHGTNP